MSKGTLNVDVQNIFPVIKQFLYTDQEIFLRELVSNAVDATQKLKRLAAQSEKEIDTNFRVDIALDTEAKTLSITDNGIGMTADEVLKYINNIAFSGAKEFAEKFADDKDSIIGHFGLGFYSAFMVADEVEIITKSYVEGAQAVRWTCKGDPEYTLDEVEKETIGTQIILHISEDAKEYLEEGKLNRLITKYLRFMPVPIFFGEEQIDTGEKDAEDKPVMESKERQVNNTHPLWIKTPSELQEEDYKAFYKELYPTKFDEPLFNIHINIDYPFQVNGVLYFPKMDHTLSENREKVKLYQKQVFVTDNLEDILPEYLSLMHGVIDSTDIPLNVSRSALQADTTVKKISNYISKKVSEKLEKIFKKDREEFEAKWSEIQLITTYGMLTDEKFYERVGKFYLYKDQDKTSHTLEELKASQKELQTNKDNKFVLLYSTDIERDHLLIEKASAKGYKVIELNLPFASNFVQAMEMKEDILCKQIDSDSFHKLIEKDEEIPAVLSEEETKQLDELFKEAITDSRFQIQIENQDSDELPISIVNPEFMRRMKEMNQMGGMTASMPDMYNLVVNANHPKIGQILGLKDQDEKLTRINYLFTIAKLSKNMLKGDELSSFVSEAFDKA